MQITVSNCTDTLVLRLTGGGGGDAVVMRCLRRADHVRRVTATRHRVLRRMGVGGGGWWGHGARPIMVYVAVRERRRGARSYWWRNAGGRRDHHWSGGSTRRAGRRGRAHAYTRAARWRGTHPGMVVSRGWRTHGRAHSSVMMHATGWSHAWRTNRRHPRGCCASIAHLKGTGAGWNARSPKAHLMLQETMPQCRTCRLQTSKLLTISIISRKL
jgi:hypothetical protein